MSILSPWRGRVWARGESPASVASVPNLISVVRVVLTPVFVWLALHDAGAMGAERLGAAVLFVVLIATDFVDGWIARSRNLVTDLGKLFDPIADKAITGAAFVVISILGELPWWITILVLVREIGITVHRLAIAKDVVIPATWPGKAKTWAQAVALAAALLPLSAWIGDGAAVVVHVVTMTVAVLLTIVSGLEYVWHVRRARR
ncbi:CDP-diacylglycerol--glycerol-3-phosphate 3-phosphatidyltransferase [Agrococcus sp. SGAir0287]|uniref:CDP-diacylglycerol--glycerol-3-phosphate 3-phosphatidyltransferase n=1 Tax=Agrococcus sp. SGAir0287 TaxID=2070347 RepID=UPI0010CCE580|nr:CDP-diacylglycerol--glycerol-3-phosphate 3-phosphatidyltransferase [Agrococcus sp. SGAir0287]QCR19622.1 CDP-diacylglycerol--glycerol-3-phosphate 3-phosphatidyltransferase [Agrococcus sp. SGAir0287]